MVGHSKGNARPSDAPQLLHEPRVAAEREDIWELVVS